MAPGPRAVAKLRKASEFMLRGLQRTVVLVAFLMAILAAVAAALRPGAGDPTKRPPRQCASEGMGSREPQPRDCEPEWSQAEPFPIFPAGKTGGESVLGLDSALPGSISEPCDLLEYLKTLGQGGQNSACILLPSSYERLAALLEEDHWQCENAMSVLFEQYGIGVKVLEVSTVRTGMNVLRRLVLDSASQSRYDWLGDYFGERAGEDLEYRLEILPLVQDPSIPMHLRLRFWEGICKNSGYPDDVGRTGLWLLEQDLNRVFYESVAQSMANAIQDPEVARRVAESAVCAICERHQRTGCSPVRPDQGPLVCCAHENAFHLIADAGGDAMHDVLNDVPHRAGLPWSAPGQPAPSPLSTRVSGRWSVAPLNQVMKDLSNWSSVDIVVDRGIDEFVSDTFEDVPVGEIMNSIVERTNCTTTELAPNLIRISRRVNAVPPHADRR